MSVEPRIGLLVGREWSFPPAFIEAVAKRQSGVVADYIKLDATRMAQPVPYTLIIDRISHEVGFYRAFLKHATRMGVTVVNNPFMWSADDKFFDATVAVQNGVAHPKTMVLPNKDYIPGISHSESLRNLAYPLDWRGVAEHIGFPCVLKDAHGGGWRDVYICHSMEELIHHYNISGLLTMVVQEFVKWDQYVRCMVLGREQVLPMPYDPRERKYIPDPGYLPKELEARVRQGRPHALPGAGLRHEHGRVRGARRHAVRDRLHEPGAGHGHLLAHPELLRVGGRAHGRPGDQAGHRAPARPVGRPADR